MTLLVPERMLVFSPTLAATIGLEEAVLLHVLHDLSVCQTYQDGRHWHEANVATLERLLPFWDRRELQRISKNLAEKGVLQIESAPLTSANTLRYYLTAEDDSEKRPPISTRLEPAMGASLLASNWRPKEDTLRWLELHKNITHEFALQQLEDFLFFWRERRTVDFAWDNKFREWVIDKRQRFLQKAAEREKQPAVALEHNWYPSEDAFQILERVEISREFIEDAIPEFLLYWRERGSADGTWNSKFLAHVRRQWDTFTKIIANERDPSPIHKNWRPSEDVYDVLRMSRIDIEFAQQQILEFVLFWLDAGSVQRSWNTKFLQHVKYQWATRHHLAGGNRAGSAIAAGTDTKQSTFEQLTDRSWAKGLVNGI